MDQPPTIENCEEIKMQQTRRGADRASYYIVLVSATLLMASGFIASKVLLAADIPPFLLVGWRFLLAAFATLPLVLFAESSLTITLVPPHFTLRDWVVVPLIGLLQTAATMGLLFMAMRTISAGTAAILLFTNPIWVALIGHFVLNERLSSLRLAALFCGVVGVSLALGASGAGLSHEPLDGQLTGLAAAFCWALATVVNKRAKLAMNVWALSFWQMLVGGVLLLLLAYAGGEHWPAPALTSARLWACFFWLAVPCSTGAFGLWFIALHRGGAAQSSGYLFLAPLFTVLMSAVILRTGLSVAQASGGVLIGLALWLVNRTGPVALTVMPRTATDGHGDS
jgi:drug/metabolite transporter (DMT)-like permease